MASNAPPSTVYPQTQTSADPLFTYSAFQHWRDVLGGRLAGASACSNAFIVQPGDTDCGSSGFAGRLSPHAHRTANAGSKLRIARFGFTFLRVTAKDKLPLSILNDSAREASACRPAGLRRGKVSFEEAATVFGYPLGRITADPVIRPGKSGSR